MRSRLPFLLVVTAAAACLVFAIPRPAAQTGPPATRPKKTAHEKFATFLNGDGFRAELLLENLRLDVPLTVESSLILRSGEVPLKTLTLAAHSSQTIDISGFMATHGYADTRGTVRVKFDFSSYGPLTAVAESEDEANHVYLNSFAQSAEEYWDGTAYDAVVWAPSKDTKGFVSIVNTSFESKTVQVTLLADGQSQTMPITIGPREAHFLRIDDLVARSEKSGAGIHIQYDEYPGDIVVEGQVYNQQQVLQRISILRTCR